MSKAITLKKNAFLRPTFFINRIPGISRAFNRYLQIDQEWKTKQS